MSDDIFADWKKNRFITVNYDLLEGQREIMVILTDISYWASRTDELIKWCERHGCEHVGMTVTFPDQKILTAFALRWS